MSSLKENLELTFELAKLTRELGEIVKLNHKEIRELRKIVFLLWAEIR